MVAGWVLGPDQSKRPLHAAQHKNSCSVVGCTAKAKASLLCKTKPKKDTGKWQEVRCKKHGQKGSARLFPLCSTLAVPSKCARVYRPRCARDLLSLAVQKHCSTRKQKKGFFHAFQRRQSDLLLLQAAATSFKHEGFAAIRTPRTGSARLVGALRVLGKMVSARSMLPLSSAL